MKVVAVGGHSRNIGKTSLMEGLLRGLCDLHWTAVKITQFGHGICSLDGRECDCAPDEHPFAVTEETTSGSRTDTGRFLAAGARRALWVRVRQGQLARAYAQLREALGEDPYVMIESNSILGLLRPALYLVVLDSAVQDFKESAQKYLTQADAFVLPRRKFDPSRWERLPQRLWNQKPTFPVSGRDFSSPELFDFVRRKLLDASDQRVEMPIKE